MVASTETNDAKFYCNGTNCCSECELDGFDSIEVIGASSLKSGTVTDVENVCVVYVVY